MTWCKSLQNAGDSCELLLNTGSLCGALPTETCKNEYMFRYPLPDNDILNGVINTKSNDPCFAKSGIALLSCSAALVQGMCSTNQYAVCAGSTELAVSQGRQFSQWLVNHLVLMPGADLPTKMNYATSLWHKGNRNIPGSLYLMDRPSANRALLNQACASQAAVMIVWASPLNWASSSRYGWPSMNMANGSFNPPFSQYSWHPQAPDWPKNIPNSGRCNHVVSLYGCDHANDVYQVWTWGVVFRVTSAFLIGTGPYNGTASHPANVPGGDPFRAASNGVVCSFVALNRTDNNAATTLNDNTRRSQKPE
jgi:hypothetical protein